MPGLADGSRKSVSVARGVTLVKHMVDNGAAEETISQTVGQTWQDTYREGLRSFLKQPIADWSRPSVWMAPSPQDPPPLPPSLLLFQCVIQPRDFQRRGERLTP